jgi:hypothetical protein
MIKHKAIAVILMLLIILLSGACQQVDDFNSKLNKIVNPYRFNIVEWEVRTLTNEFESALFGVKDYAIDDSLNVVNYFKLLEDISQLEFQISYYRNTMDKEDLAAMQKQLEDLKLESEAGKKEVENILEMQIRDTLNQLDLYWYKEIVGLNISFPPINFSLEPPPHLLIVSPRDSISRMKEIILLQDLSLDEIEYIETEIDKLGYSSIVLELGGMATFPSFVNNNAGLEYTISTAIEEWFHQYFFFKPAGFLYAFNLLGIYTDSDISTINETVAGIVSDEIASIVYRKYYSAYYENITYENTQGNEFDFYEEMRNIRLAVDNYLANGEIELAEAFMEEKRLYILSQGYYIRRLNQAYFAFYGTYASSPSSVNPIGDMLWDLRKTSAGVTDFIKIAGTIRNIEDLKSLIKLY